MTLETPRLTLRPWRKGDAPALVAGLGKIEVSQWLAAVPHPYTLEHAKAFLQFCRRIPEDYQWAIVLKSNGEVIGGTTLNQINQNNGTASGGIWINADYHGHGYGIEAFNARIRFAFEELGLRRIDNGFLAGNEASKRMQERLGYQVEGLRRAGFLCRADGIVKDEYITGLLREEWAEARTQI